jgi:exosortase
MSGGRALPMEAPLQTAVPASGAHPATWIGPTVLVLGLLIVIYHRTVAALWSVWTTNDNDSHGPLIPLVSLAIVWSRRRRIAATPRAPSAAGLAVVALACALQVVGVRADVFALQGYSMVLMLIGLSLALGGVAVTRLLAFPILYLGFMLTFPPFVMNQLSYALKEIAVRLSTHAAELLGVTLRRTGMTLLLGNGMLQIENPCSGLRSLLAMLATGAVFAMLQPGAVWRRALLGLLAIPVAIFANAVRLTLLIVVAHYAGVPRAMGAVHDVSGYLTFALALAGLWLGRVWLMPRASSARSSAA